MVRPLHPKERQLYSRRAFLQRAALAGIAVPSLSAILAACGSGAQSSVATSAASGGSGSQFGTGGISGAAYPLARPDAPVTWNVDDTELIASDLPPEENATVKILRWPYYLAPSVIKSFEKKYSCTVEQTEFADMDKGLAKINTGQGDFDLLVGMNVWAVGRSIAAGLLRPINLDYIPNLPANCWDTFQSPFYDVDSHYTLPYSVWSTGIFWRNDKISADIAGMANPYDIFWDGAPMDKTAPARQRAGRPVDGDVPRGPHRRERHRSGDDQLSEGRDRRRSSTRRTPRSTTSTTPTSPRAGVPAPVVVGQRQRRLRVPAIGRAGRQPVLLWPVESGHAGQRRQRHARPAQHGQGAGARAPAGELYPRLRRTRSTNFETPTGYQMPIKAMTRMRS